MRKKFFYLLFVLCLVKLYHIADRSLQFSPNLLINSFKQNVEERSSLGNLSVDVIPIRNFFLNKNVLEYKLSKEILKNHEIYYQRLMEFTYPIKIKQKASILVSLKNEATKSDCKLLHSTRGFNIYECK